VRYNVFPPQEWNFEADKNDFSIDNGGLNFEGINKIKVYAQHKDISSWQLDKDPSTFYYQKKGYHGNDVNYEPGLDENHVVIIDNYLPYIEQVMYV
jgi:hypothetical protein